MTERLRLEQGLRISSVLDGAGESLQLLVQYATHPEVTTRFGSTRDFLKELQHVEEELTRSEARSRPDPVEARPKNELDHGLVVKRRLGKGATALALLVERDGREHVLKVALSAEHNERLRAEADVLRRLRYQYIVELYDVLTFKRRRQPYPAGTCGAGPAVGRAQSLWLELRLTTTATLADLMREDQEFLQVAELLTGRPDFDVAKLVAGLIEDHSVPLLPVLRYKASGLRKRDAWERTWGFQRRKDAIDAQAELPVSDPERLTLEQAAALKAKEIGTIPAPPRYTSADFRKGVWWRLRGKLDVPKERFVSLPFCEREADPSLVIGWAGWNALEQGRAVAAYFLQMREQEGWTAERLTPLPAALLELRPWTSASQCARSGVRRWDGRLLPGFIDDEVRPLSLTREAIRAWAPPAGHARRGNRRRSSAAGA